MATDYDETDSVFPEDFEQDGNPSSRASSRPGSQSPADMDNILLDELPVEKLYEYFTQASDLSYIVYTFDALKTKLELEGLEGIALFRALQVKLGTQKTWKARDVLQMLDKRANQQEYMQQSAAKGVKVLIVGGGPIGLRLAIDCLLLGCEVRVIEKRQTFSRNNVLHLWPFTIEDLRQLGAKKFYGKFCAGAIDHISIRSLQCILLKICLLLGLSFHVGVEFKEVLEPTEDRGWHAKLNPSDHFLNEFDFDVLVGADGRRSTVPGFDRKELRGKLALAITANFVNYFTRDEAAVDEISGVAFIFNQKFFKDLKSDTGIDLENIVYYKDDTHYFVMTAKKDSLLKKGVLLADYSDTRRLLHPSNINKEELCEYAFEAADWSTELPTLDFAGTQFAVDNGIRLQRYMELLQLNHYNEPDVALFDFTSIFQAEYAARAVRRRGKNLILSVVGDALLEPFWPIGTGCARGFLSAMDTAWMIRSLGQGRRMLDLLCEREVISQRLPQTTPERLQQNIKCYTINPTTRYMNLHLQKLPSSTVKHLYDTDTAAPSPALQRGSIRVKSSSATKIYSDDKENKAPDEAMEVMDDFAPVLASPSSKPLVEGSVQLAYYSEPDNHMSLSNPSVLLKWAQKHVKGYGIQVTDLSTSWSDGMALCALIHRFHPELIPTFLQLSPANPIHNNQLAFSIAEEHFNITPLLQPSEMAKPDKITLFTYLSLFYEYFANCEPAEIPESGQPNKAQATSPQKTPMKRRSSKLTATPPSVERSWNTQTVKRRSMSPPPNDVIKVARGEEQKSGEPPKKKLFAQPKPVTQKRNSAPKKFTAAATTSSDICYFCNKRVYLMEKMSTNGLFFHRTCFRCSHCNCQLKIGGFSLSKGEGGEKGKFFCNAHYRQLFLSNPEAINYSRAGAGRKERREEAVMEEEPQREGFGLDRVVEEEEEEVEEEVVEEVVVREEERGRVQVSSVSDMEVEVEEPIVIKVTSADVEEKGDEGRREVVREEERVVVREEERVVVREVERREVEESLMEVEASAHGKVSFRPRQRSRVTTSNVRRLTANYEQKERSRTVDGAPVGTLTRSSHHVPRQRHRHRGGQRSAVRHMAGTLDHTDVAIQERRKQQQRFREAQLIQREMSQLERQHEELEEVGKNIEQALRDAEGTAQEDRFMESWLQLVNERNGLVRKMSELSQRTKELELEDRQYEVDKELNELNAIPEDEQTQSQKERFEELFMQKLALVEDRNELVIQIDEERKREQEENVTCNSTLDQIRRDSVESRGSSGSESSPASIKRVTSAPNIRYRKKSEVIEGADQVEEVLMKDKRRSRIKSWLGWSK